MRILADQARNVRRRVLGKFGPLVEQLIQLLKKRLSTSKQLDVPLRVVLDTERGLPGIGFGVIVPLFRVSHSARVEGLSPFAVFQARTYEARLGIENIAIVFGAFEQEFPVFRRSHRIR